MPLDKEKKFKERRKYKRFETSLSIIEPVELIVPKLKKKLVGIIADISAGGMAIIMYSKIPAGTKIDLSFSLIGLKLKNIRATVVRIRENYNTFLTAFQFDKLSKTLEKHINEIAMDYDDCEIKWVRGETNICSRGCKYYPYCPKSIKKK
jgi:c-di-GMP-binding flagellar brake protein YcgR